MKVTIVFNVHTNIHKHLFRNTIKEFVRDNLMEVVIDNLPDSKSEDFPGPYFDVAEESISVKLAD